MKFRLFVLMLALSLVGWAQETPAGSSTPNSTPATQTKACCHHNVAGKDGKSSCCHQAADAKDAMACCSKDKCAMKDGKSCCDGKDTKAAMEQCKKSGCCKEGKCCGDKESDKTAEGCCGSKCQGRSQTPAGS